MDEIYEALHPGEKPPFTNSRVTVLYLEDLWEAFLGDQLKPIKFLYTQQPIIFDPKSFYFPTIVD